MPAPSAKRAKYAEAAVFGEEINQLGDPFGKELTLFNLDELYSRGNGAIQAKFIKSFGSYKMPMGVEAMSEEVIICNMNNGTVEFTDFDGNVNLELPGSSQRGPKSFQEPSIATILLDCRILVVDKAGCHIYSGTGEWQKTVKPKGLGGDKKIFGVLPFRRYGGQIALVVEQDNGTNYKYLYYDSEMNHVKKEVAVDFGADNEGKKTIRFSSGYGNTILLSDMNKIHQGIWITDMQGNIRHKVGTRSSDDEGEFIQASGVCFDNRGNFLAICSKTSRVMAFRSDGSFMCELQFPEGAVLRPSDLSVNDDGKMAMVSLSGQCFMFELKAGNPNETWPTRGPKPAGGYGRGRGRGRGRGGRGRGFRGRGGSFKPRY